MRKQLVRFGVFEFDLASGDLWKGGRRVRLQNQPRQVLSLLVSRPGELVHREELRRRLWPDDTFVDFDNGVNVAVRKIRGALGDLAPSPRFVETERALGYRFIAPVTEVESSRREGRTLVEEPSVPFDIKPLPSHAATRPGGGRRRLAVSVAVLTVLALAIGLTAIGIVRVSLPLRHAGQLTYTQITNFTDSAIAPALSPDGRLVAFYRSDRWFLTPDQVWVKLLPNGEPIQLTHAPHRKYGLAFSPDGTRIAFTVAGPPAWLTLSMSPLGGDPTLMMENAAGLTWIDRDELLFSEIRTGLHMGIVASRENRSDRREVYFPAHERAMAHYSYLSPDRRWVLVIEMDHVPVWQPCRVVPFDGSSAGWQVGPRGSCSSAAWSPDGQWMYFTVEVNGSSHLWRQRFPRGEPEQLTSGPNEASGVALFPDGRSLITSIGVHESAVWIRDSRGERPITSQGYIDVEHPSSTPQFSVDGKYVYYLLRRDSPASSRELWRIDLETEKSEPMMPGFSIIEYDISQDGREVVFWTQPAGGHPQLWLAPLGGRGPAKPIRSGGDASPHFGPRGEIVFRTTEGASNYLAVMNADGSGRRKVAPYPIGTLQTVSPDGQWAVAVGGTSQVPGSTPGSVAIPVAGGPPRRICPVMCAVRWAPDGRFFYVTFADRSRTDAGKTLAIPLRPGEMLPSLAPEGIRGSTDADRIHGARLIEEGGHFTPSLEVETYAFVKVTVHRNLFQITLH